MVMSSHDCYEISKRLLGIDYLTDALRGHWQALSNDLRQHRFMPPLLAPATAPAPHPLLRTPNPTGS